MKIFKGRIFSFLRKPEDINDTGSYIYLEKGGVAFDHKGIIIEFDEYSKLIKKYGQRVAQNFNELEGIAPKKLKYTDCIKSNNSISLDKVKSSNPLNRLIGDLTHIDWKTVYKGFKEFKIPLNDNDSVKLIKMDPGTSVPLHSHNGKEYILVLDGSFCDEYGEIIYKKI